MKILIIDDSSFARRSVMKFLKLEFPDAEYIMAENGQEGYEKFVENHPELTCVDLLMPVLDGAGFIQKAKAYNNDSKIAVLSADVQELVKDEIRSMDVIAFINKPINPDKAAEIAESYRGSV